MVITLYISFIEKSSHFFIFTLENVSLISLHISVSSVFISLTFLYYFHREHYLCLDCSVRSSETDLFSLFMWGSSLLLYLPWKCPHPVIRWLQTVVSQNVFIQCFLEIGQNLDAACLILRLETSRSLLFQEVDRLNKWQEYRVLESVSSSACTESLQKGLLSIHNSCGNVNQMCFDTRSSNNWNKKYC